MLVNIQITSERADKKVWENNRLSGSNSDVVIANENSLGLAFIYPEMFKKKKKKKKKKLSSKHGTARLSARLSARKIALCKCCTCRTAQRRPVSNGSGAARQAVQFKGALDHRISLQVSGSERRQVEWKSGQS